MGAVILRIVDLVGCCDWLISVFAVESSALAPKHTSSVNRLFKGLSLLFVLEVRSLDWVQPTFSRWKRGGAVVSQGARTGKATEYLSKELSVLHNPITDAPSSYAVTSGI